MLDKYNGEEIKRFDDPLETAAYIVLIQVLKTRISGKRGIMSSLGKNVELSITSKEPAISSNCK